MNLVEKIQNITKEIQDQFLANDTPWVIGYSGGKDSTAVLQFILYALARLPKEKLTKEVHVLSNDTLVENPAVVKYIDEQLALIERVGKQKLFSHHPNLFQVAKVTPKVGDRFWLNLIGKGYPAPNRWFRWCTERLKISPTNEYIKDQVSRLGEAIVVLGSRKAESKNRAKSIEKFDIEEFSGDKLQKHSLPNSWAYKPIVDLTTDDVWKYLMSVPSFWGGDNKKLITMYRNASDTSQDCPLVIDTSTSSCGTSRFGCWVCTVVSRDKSMENLIDSGEDWMIPMLDFRNYLAEVREDEATRFPYNRLNQDKLGPFRFHIRADLLRRLLVIEEETGMELITRQELAAIQMQWNYDGCFDHNVPDIYLSVKNKNIAMPNSNNAEKRALEEFELLREVATQNDVNPNHIRELLLTEKEYITYLRRGSVFNEIQKKIERFVERENPLVAEAA
jgi:DNA sulfur modification protein DndC